VNKIYYALCASLLLFSVGLFAEGEITDSQTGEKFPATVSFEEGGKKIELQATGVSTRKKLMFKVYSVASYLEGGLSKEAANRTQAVLDSDKAKQLTLKWVRGVEAAKVADGYRESFKIAADGQEAALSKEINQYIGFFNHDVSKGEEQVIRQLPGGVVQVYINGKLAGTITNEAFAKVLWKIWFGKKSVVNSEQLVSIVN
jgi:hypothetical protein